MKYDMEFVKEFVTFLHQKEIIKFGDFTLASGKSSSYYVDLRLVPSYPQEFRMMVKYLENQITKEKQFNDEIEKKYQTLKIAKTIEGSKEDRRETKLKINALIREIDTCITQLSE